MPFRKGMLGERVPNLTVFRTAETQINDPRYHKGNPAARDSNQKEAFPVRVWQRMVSSISLNRMRAKLLVVAGFGVKGTNDKESPMPSIHKPPILFWSLPELAAVDTWLYVREGRTLHR